MKKLFSSIVMVLTLMFGAACMAPATVYADDGDCGGNGSTFFSLKPWYAGLMKSDNKGGCEVDIPNKTGDSDKGEGLAKFVWGVVLNILYDLSVIVGYLTVIMVVWGGYLYMFSSGMPDRAEKGKKTLTAAFIGLAIAMLASVILNSITVILIG